MANAAIPIQLANAPQHAGMVIPYITLHHVDGTPEFGRTDDDRVAECILDRRCQLCAQVLSGAAVLMARPQDFGFGYVNEPAQHPWCAAYAVKACPMLLGRLPRLRDRVRRPQRQCSIPAACWCGQETAPSADAIIRSGRAATPWYSIRFQMHEYEVKMTARKGPRGISLRALTDTKVRLVSWGDPDLYELGRILMNDLPQPEAGSGS